MRIPRVVTNVSLLVGALASPAFAAEGEAPAAPKGLLPIPDYKSDVCNRAYLAGDFNGGRTAMAEKGIQIEVDWTQTGQMITQGGRDTDKAYGGSLDYLINLDLMRMGILPGALLTIRAESRYGESVNGAAGPVLPVNTDGFFPLTNQLDDGIAITVTNVLYTQFLSEQFAIFGGKLDTLSGDPNEFASGRGTTQFMNANFVFNSSVALRFPYSTLGGGFVFMPNKDVKITGSVFNTIDSSTTTGFSDIGDGYTATLEADFQYRLGKLPGGFNIGGLYAWDQDFAQINGELIFVPGQGLIVPNEDDTWAVYSSMWQYLWVADPSDKPINAGDGEPDHKGIGVFARLGFADEDTNPIKWTGSCGIGGKGMIPGRERDTFGIGYYYSRFEKNRFAGLLGVDDNTQGGEAFYDIAITPAVHLTFDAQVVEPTFDQNDTAVVLGMRLNMSF